MLTDLTAQAKQEGVLAGYNSVRVPQLAMTTKAKSQTVAYDPFRRTRFAFAGYNNGYSAQFTEWCIVS